MIFLVAFVLLNAFFIFASLLPHWKSKNVVAPAPTFVLNIVGYLVVLVTIYAVVKTSGNTIFILLIPILIALLIFLKKNGFVCFRKNKSEIQYLFKLLLVVNVIFILKSLLLFQGSSEYIKLVHSDYIFYARVAVFLRDFNVESAFVNSFAKPVPYHYFELWITAFFSEFGLNAYVSLMLVTYPLFLSLTVILAYLLVSNKLDHKKALLFSVFILFVQMMYFPFLYDKIPFLSQANTFCITPWWYQKVSVIYFWFLVAIVLYKYYGINAFLNTLALFPVIYGSSIFATVGVLGMSLLLKLFIAKDIAWKSVFILFMSLLSFQLFYHFNNYGESLSPKIDGLFIKTSFNIIVGSVIQITIFTIPYCIVLFFYRKSLWGLLKYHFFLISILLGACICAVLGWALFHLQSDVVQVFSNFSISILSIGIAFLFTQVNYKLFLITFLLVLLINIRNYFPPRNTKDLNVKEWIFESRNKGVFLKNTAEYDNVFNINPSFSSPLIEMFIINDNIKMDDLSIVDVNLNNHKHINLLVQYIKYNTLQKYSSVNLISGIQAKVGFIKSNQIEFLVCKKNYPLSNEISKLFKFKKEIDGNVVWYK